MENMRIAMVTTWNVKCGISEYSRDLVYSLRELGVEVVVFSKRDENVYPDEDFVKRVTWNNIYDFCAHIIDRGFDAVHFQNQGSFWSKEWFEGVLKVLKEAGIRTIVTFHDSAIWTDFDFSNIKDIIAHRVEILDKVPRGVVIGQTCTIVPMGVLYLPPKICSFGIGRNDNEAVRTVCDSLGFVYHVINPQYKWLSQGELIKTIREYDAVVLWYGEVGIVGCSAGARMAISSRRPVFTSDVTWFKDVPDHLITKSQTLEELKEELRGYFDNHVEEYLKNNNWDLVALEHKDIYEQDRL